MKIPCRLPFEVSQGMTIIYCDTACGDLNGLVGMISLFQTLRGSSSVASLIVTRLCHSDAIYRRESSEESVYNYNEDARSLPF